MRLLRKYYYFLFFTLFLIIYAVQKLDYTLPYYIHNHASNLLCMPIILKTIQWVLKITFKKNIRLGFINIFSITCYFSWYFEYYLPKHDSRYTADLYDVFLYFIGSFVYCYLEKYFKKIN